MRLTHLSSHNSLATRLVYEKISIIYLRHMQEVIVFGVCKCYVFFGFYRNMDIPQRSVCGTSL